MEEFCEKKNNVPLYKKFQVRPLTFDTLKYWYQKKGY